MGLTSAGFVPDGYEEILNRIKTRLETFSEGIDLSAEAPDGYLATVFSFELGEAYNQLNLVYNSYNPNEAKGTGLRNIGMISGLAFGAATRSQVDLQLGGVVGTAVPAGSIVEDGVGNQFKTSFSVVLPATVQAIAVLSGAVQVSPGTVVNIVTNIAGWNTVTQLYAGREGADAQTEAEYRNLRNRTVLRNFTDTADVITARISEELGTDQVTVLNNDNPAEPLSDGTPANTIHVTIGEVGAHITNAQIGEVISKAKGLGCPTYGSTSVIVPDSQGVEHTIYFSKASPKGVFMDINVTYLTDDYAGADESIKQALLLHVNSLATNEDVVWSRLFGLITPYAKAQINSLKLSKNGTTYVSGNLTIEDDEFATMEYGSIKLVRTNDD